MSRRKANRNRMEVRKLKQLRRNTRISGVVVRKSHSEWAQFCTKRANNRRKAKEQGNGIISSK